MPNCIIIHGDSKKELRKMRENSVDAIVTDPPYGLKFMAHKWDYDVPGTRLWEQCLRVLKPGGHLLAFAGTRTQHRMAVRIEDAGFEIRDMIAWVYSQGFPKSVDLGKQCEELAGWGTALKPAMEPITVARKPLIRTIAKTVELFGTGGLNIDASRIPFAGEADFHSAAYGTGIDFTGGHYGAGKGKAVKTRTNIEADPKGRFPANFIHDGSDEILSNFPFTDSGQPRGRASGVQGNVYGRFDSDGREVTGYGDSGNAARFFYCAKPTPAERNSGGPNNHPTVKPLALMSYLVKLITPAGGMVLDPFCGSGTTLAAALSEGFDCIGIEKEEEYVEIARRRTKIAPGRQTNILKEGGA